VNETKAAATAELIQVLTYAGHELELCLEPDGNASVYLAPRSTLVWKSDVISQCWHLAKWKLRSNLTRVKLQQQQQQQQQQKAKF
jgi:hypothetical protein